MTSFDPGWLMETCRRARIRVMLDHSPECLKSQGFYSDPASEEEAKALYEAMSVRFRSWTGKTLQEYARATESSGSDKADPAFITGWLTKEFAAGRRPAYGYPSASLPAVKGEMEIVTGYMAPRAKPDQTSAV